MPQSLCFCLIASLLVTIVRADFTFYQGRTEYILVTTAKTWDLAEADAVAKGGHLAQINNSAENALILGKIREKVTTTAAAGGSAAYAWLGGIELSEGDFSWSGGGAFWNGGSAGTTVSGAYANWGRLPSSYGGPEPDNALGNQNRVAMAAEPWPVGAAENDIIGAAGQWNDLPSDQALFYIIERPITKPSEGLFAVFTMTYGGNPAGSFTCQLHYDKSPIAVANFVSLAEGTRGWLDVAHGKISHARFYDGLKFHRIISNFMIQSGSTNGDGTGGPGYQFVDEFHPELSHDHLGVLSLANNGKNSNESQFFVTVDQRTYLDGMHTIFGRVVEGYESCVVPLSQVATNAGEKPLQDVVISSIAIQRIGPAAQAFDPLDPAWGLPTCAMQQTTIERSPAGEITLYWPETANVSYVIVDSPNLQQWRGSAIPYYSGYKPEIRQSINVSSLPAPAAPRHFFNLATIHYTPLMPQTLSGKTFVLQGKKIGITTSFTLNTATNGAHLIDGAGYHVDSALSNVDWSVFRFDQAYFESDFSPALEVSGYQLVHSDWEFRFNRKNGGTFKGGFYDAIRSVYLEEYGEFTMSPVSP